MAAAVFEALKTINQVFEAGIAITALSLFLRALTFNLRDRVSRAFTFILACVMVVFSGEAISSAVNSAVALEFWLRFQWIGIVFLPAAYIHFSDALLATTGRPSRGRRRLAVRLAYGLSATFLVMLPISWLVGPVVLNGEPIAHLERTWLSWLFTAYYALVMVLSGSILWRAYKRTVLTASRRRMHYLLLGAVALALGSYPYLMLGSGLAASYPILFLFAAALGNILVFVSLVAMAYAVAFFGVPWPDRIVKSRLFKWLLRGPATVFVVLAAITSLRRLGETLGAPISVLIPIITVATVLLMEHLITLAAPVWERWLFHGGDRENLRLLHTLEERLITTGDLGQFLEAVLAAVCDQFQVSTAFLAVLGSQGLEQIVQVGDKDVLGEQNLSDNLLEAATDNHGQQEVFAWGDFWLAPLEREQGSGLLGLMGVLRQSDKPLEDEHRLALENLGQRAALALEDRLLQQQVFRSLEDLNPRVELIQRLRAAASYDQSEMLTDLEELRESVDISQWVKDALSHYWGGPKLTQSPLLRLQIVQQALEKHEGNPANALRAILKEAIERIRPEGDRRFTAEWILYNILEMKFMEGHKVREVAMRLAMSEADLYRKQRVAVEEVANAIIEMERTARNGGTVQEELVSHEAQRVWEE